MGVWGGPRPVHPRRPRRGRLVPVGEARRRSPGRPRPDRTGQRARRQPDRRPAGLRLLAFFTVVAGYAQVPSSAGYGVGASTLQVGLFPLPCGLAMIVLTPLAGRLTLRIGAAATVALGSLIITGAFAWLLLRPGDAPTLWVGSVVSGLGLGIGYSALGTMAIQDIPEAAEAPERLPPTVRISPLMPLTSLILSTHLDRRTGQPTLTGYHAVFTVLGVVCVAAAALAGGRTRTDGTAGRHPGRSPHSTRRLRPSHVCAMTTRAKKAPLTTCW
ncbi:MFS transporter [Streptomyces sp. NPDC006333]|uniref:MFS transporter n=1 Tax=Streptomyces sp. NPDC006333 TaxID=3156753 RepID=UPI0033A26BB7